LHAKQFDENFEQLAAELQTLDSELGAALAPLARQPLVASHPVYQYLARRYALELRSIVFDPSPSVPAAGDSMGVMSLRRSRPTTRASSPGTNAPTPCCFERWLTPGDLS
jgi:zinc transport system substrate-binding protein